MALFVCTMAWLSEVCMHANSLLGGDMYLCAPIVGAGCQGQMPVGGMCIGVLCRFLKLEC